MEELPANTGEGGVQSLGREDPLEKEMSMHSSILAWRIRGQRSLAGYGPWSCRVRHNGGHTHCVDLSHKVISDNQVKKNGLKVAIQFKIKNDVYEYNKSSNKFSSSNSHLWARYKTIPWH